MANFNTGLTKAQIITALTNGLNAVTESDLNALSARLELEIDEKADGTDLAAETAAREAADAAHDTLLADLIDNGAKNVFTTTAGTSTITDVTFTNNGDGTWSTSGTAAARRQKSLAFTVSSSLPAGRYVISGCPQGGASGTTINYCLYLWDATTNTRVSDSNVGNGIVFDWTPNPTHTYQIVIDIRSGVPADNLLFKPMICLKAAWDISNKFVSYCPTLAELYAMIQNL